jgi:hypothetical protein
MFWNRNGELTMLDVVEKSTCEPELAAAPPPATSDQAPRRFSTPSMLTSHLNEPLMPVRTQQHG